MGKRTRQHRPQIIVYVGRISGLLQYSQHRPRRQEHFHQRRLPSCRRLRRHRPLIGIHKRGQPQIVVGRLDPVGRRQSRAIHRRPREQLPHRRDPLLHRVRRRCHRRHTRLAPQASARLAIDKVVTNPQRRMGFQHRSRRQPAQDMLTQRGQVLTGLAWQQLGRMPLTRIERPQPHKQVARAILGQLRRIELQRLKDAQATGQSARPPGDAVASSWPLARSAPPASSNPHSRGPAMS
jgi:hypothetical protein